MTDDESKVDMVDVTGKARPRRDIEAALRFVENQIIHNPMAFGPDGVPSLMHLTVIRDALRAYLEVCR